MDPNDEYRQYMQRVVNATREANYGLWNALLTLDGIIVSVFSAVAIFEARLKFLAFLIVLASMVSAALMLLNFRSTRALYRLLGVTRPEEVERMTPQQREQQVKQAGRKHDHCNCRENAAYLILVAQAVMILVLVYWKHP
jgi:hypothetical protein